MIRSNPTSIQLRAADVKTLQAVIDARRSAREGDAAGASATGAATGAAGTGAASRAGETQAQAQQGSEAYNAVEARRRERAGMTRDERIGLPRGAARAPATGAADRLALLYLRSSLGSPCTTTSQAPGQSVERLSPGTRRTAFLF
ncbi:hypothetical protein Q5752_000145 [Cryptotrichosporon argae]